ncbi:DUF2892 domain-containing protein [Actinomyces ruminicola]|uniref:DUF2892 domain-containing protein n=1 Tax=Actinomyces ruminicola TaxID=332524 RepID=UPI00115FB5EB|nr:DUF2892 domain-containing protein [Actinomyces ruminicola]
MTSANADSGEESVPRPDSPGAGAGAGAQSAELTQSSGKEHEDEALAVALFRRRVLRTLAGCLVVVLLAAGGVGGWLWWTRPLTRQVALPDELAAKDGTYAQLHVSIEPIETAAGQLQVGPLRSERHEWIGTLAPQRRHPRTH